MTGADEQDFSELAAAYALGALEPDEARAFEARLAGSPALQQEVAAYREVNALLALGAPTRAPDAALRSRVVERATRDKVVAIPARSPWMAWAALAASLVAVAGLGIGQRNLRQELAARDTALAALRDSLTARETSLALRENELNAILDPNVVLARMGTPGTPQPVVQLFWNRQTHLIMAHAFNLPPAAKSRAYQLWFIPKGGKPIPSVTFNTETSGHALVQRIAVPQGVELTAAAITEEPEAGSPQPTTTPFLVASLAPAAS